MHKTQKMNWVKCMVFLIVLFPFPKTSLNKIQKKKADSLLFLGLNK